MLSLGVFLVVLSPFTALVPVAYTMYLVYKSRYAVLQNPAVLRSPWNIGLFFVFMWSAAVGFVNLDKLSLAAAFVLLGYLSLSIYFQMFCNTESKVEVLVKTVHKFSIFSAILGLIEKAASLFYDMSWISRFFWSPTYVPDPEAHRIYSTFGNPNITGAWFAAMVLVSYYFFEKETGKRKPLFILAAVLFAVAMAFTGSRGAVLGLVAGFIVYAFFRKDQGSLLPLGLMFTLVVGLTLIVPEINHPLNSREYIWDLCIDMFKQKPISGWGLLGIYRNFGEIHGHNIWLTVAATLGTVGLSAYFYLKYHLVQGLKFLHENKCALTPLLAAIQALIIGHGLVDFIILVPQGGLLFFATSGLIFAMTGEISTSTARARVPSVWRGPSGTTEHPIKNLSSHR